MSLNIVDKIFLNNLAGTRRQTGGTFTGPASYATGGDVNTIGNLTGGRMKQADFVQVSDSHSGTYRASVIYSTDKHASSVKVMVYVIATGAQVANAVDLSAEKFRVVVQGA